MEVSPHTAHTPTETAAEQEQGKEKKERKGKGAISHGVLVLASCQLTVTSNKPLSLTSPKLTLVK